MKIEIDLTSPWWNEYNNGDLCKVHIAESGGFANIPFEIIFQWTNGGWNQIVGITFGNVNLNIPKPKFENNFSISPPINSTDPLAVKVEAIHPDYFLPLMKQIETFAQDFERTRKLVSFLKFSSTEIYKVILNKQHVGSLAAKSNKGKNSDDEKLHEFLVTYRLGQILKSNGFEDFVKWTCELLAISKQTYYNHCKKAELYFATSTRAKTKSTNKRSPKKSSATKSTTTSRKRNVK